MCMLHPVDAVPKDLAAAELLESQINLVECQWTATALGDPIEIMPCSADIRHSCQAHEVEPDDRRRAVS